MVGLQPTAGLGAFLDRLDPVDRSDLLRLGGLRRFPKGSHVIVQGDDGDTVFVLLEGYVKVVLTTAAGRSTVLAVLGPGEMLGEFEAVRADRARRDAGNVAVTPIVVRAITGADFVTYLESHARATLALLRGILGRFGSADRRLVDSGTLDSPHRLARLLLELADRYGRPADGGVRLDLPLTQEELAGLIATSRESVVRALAGLRRAGYVTTGRRTIVLRDVDGLRGYADGA